MSKYYEKSVGKGEKFLYDSSGKCIGRGVTDKNGKTIYSGAGGYIGKSYETGHGTIKHYDSNNNYVGTGVKRSDISAIDVETRSTDSQGGYESRPAGSGCLLVGCWAIIMVFVLSIIKTLAG